MNQVHFYFVWLFVMYSFAGWAIGTILAAGREKKFIDVGFLYGPFCPAYGFGALCFTIFLSELKDHLFFLFLGGAILSFFVTYVTGGVLEKIFHRKWWDYSRKKLNFAGIVHFPYVVIWGGAAVLVIKVLNPLLEKLLVFLPQKLETFLLLFFMAIILIDFVTTVTGIIQVHTKLRQMSVLYEVSDNLQKTADLMGDRLTKWTLKHLEHAYPYLETKQLLLARQEKEKEEERKKAQAGIFAVGCCYHKMVWLFFLGALLGDLTETIFCYVTAGVLMSRSSVVYGPFSIVWGLGCVLLTLFLYQYRNHSDRYIFAFGTILGGAYEYICSVFTEIVFGTVFWDYSKIPFNLGGRINLLYCFFWGIAAVVWMKLLYPRMSALIEKIPKKPGILLTKVIVLFMIFNIIISAMAMGRYTQRHSGNVGAEHAITKFLDERFPDERMERIYPNAIIVEK